MQTPRHSACIILSAILMGGAFGCRAPSRSSPRAATQPAQSTSGGTIKTFRNPDTGILFMYPASWTPTKGQTTLFQVSDPDAKGSASLCLDVPHLPFHIPGMITPGAVAHGYIDDLKKNRIHDGKVDEETDIEVSGAKAKRVKVSGHENGQVSIDVAVLIVHDDKVYILSCDSDQAGYVAARQALDGAVGSVEWIK